MSKWKSIALTFAIFAGSTIVLFALTRPGVMEKKYLSLRDDMTKGEVEAILGKTGGTVGGGFFSTSEQYQYVWSGDDGLISISYVDPNDHPIWGAPGMDHRIAHKSFQPRAESWFRVNLP